MWTERRLQRLYQRYNRRYWRGELCSFKVEIEACRRSRGFTHHLTRRIVVDVDGPWLDDDIRLTLLHEMVHVAVPDSPSHGLGFWLEVDRLLQKGAPAELVLPISPWFRAILGTQASPTQLYYCKRAVRKVEAARKRLRQWEEQSDLEGKHRKIIAQFRTLAPEATWTRALARIGQRTDLVDEYGKPRGGPKAKVLALVKKRFQEERRWQLRRQRRSFRAIEQRSDA